MCVNGGDGKLTLMRILDKASVFPGTVLKIMAFLCKIGAKFKDSTASHSIFKTSVHLGIANPA
jgi:hypothetical protein